MTISTEGKRITFYADPDIVHWYDKLPKYKGSEILNNLVRKYGESELYTNFQQPMFTIGHSIPDWSQYLQLGSNSPVEYAPTERKIEQFVPPNNHFARFLLNEKEFVFPILTFAYVSSPDGKKSLVGIITLGTETHFCDELPGFQSYISTDYPSFRVEP